MILESKLLSKVLEDGNFFILNKYNITEDDFTSELNTYIFIRNYVKEYGVTPDYRTVVSEVSTFKYMAEVIDTWAYLCKSIKNSTARRNAYNVLQNHAGKNYETMKGKEFADWLYEEAERIKRISDSSSSMGSNYANNGVERKQRYIETKDKQSELIIPTPYESLNKALGGGMELGDYVLLQAFSNKGKSWLASHIGVFTWRFNFGVMHYSPELSKPQQENRLDTIDGNFNNVNLRNGELDNEAEYFNHLDTFKENNTPYIIKTMEDMPEGLSVDVIEADLSMHPEIKMVIIDGFNLMVHGKGKLDRNAMTQTSRKLRQIFSRYNVVGLVVHQVNAEAERNGKKVDEDDDNAIPSPPEITDYSETIAVIQDACTVLGFNANDGRGVMKVNKCRGEGKDTIIDFNLNYNIGIIKERTYVDHF